MTHLFVIFCVSSLAHCTPSSKVPYDFPTISGCQAFIKDTTEDTTYDDGLSTGPVFYIFGCAEDM